VTTDPLMIEVTLHELVTKETNPNVPYGPDEVALDGAACVEAGVTLLHFHARDPQTGEQRWLDHALYADAIGRLRAAGVPADLPWYPTYPGLRPGVAVSEPLHHVSVLAQPPVGLEIAAIDVGTFNLSPYDAAHRAFVAPNSVKVLPHGLFEEFTQFCTLHHLRPYLGVYEPGHLRHLAAYAEMGWIEPPLVIKFFFSEHHPYNLPPVARSIEMYAELLGVVLPGVEVVWFVQCYGHAIWELARAAIDLGGHVRVGLGDYHPWDWPDPAGEKPTNVELVASAVALADRAQRPLATIADARRMLGVA
jgi:3-keto-5-aminohexanoate cleavage enzyme